MKYTLNEMASSIASYFYTGKVHGGYELGYRLRWKSYEQMVRWIATHWTE